MRFKRLQSACAPRARPIFKYSLPKELKKKIIKQKKQSEKRIQLLELRKKVLEMLKAIELELTETGEDSDQPSYFHIVQAVACK